MMNERIAQAYEAELAKKYSRYISLSFKYSKQLSAAEDEIRELREQLWKLEDENEELNRKLDKLT